MKRLIHVSLTCIAVIFLLWFIAPIAYGVHNIGTVVGLSVCCAVIFRFSFVKIYYRIKAQMCRRKVTKIILRAVQAIAVLFVVYAATVSGFMIYAMTVTPSNDDTAVVLGAQVKPWGASPLLQQRIDAAQEYLESHQKANAVVTGGQGADEPMSEGQCIYDNLTAAGIAPRRIYIEDKAVNTEQNICYSLTIIRNEELNKNIAVVTDSYHQLRARIIAHKTDSTVHVSAVNTHNNLIGLSTYPTYFVREWLAIPVEIIK
ncbi:MAG: YdcF family protein [Ruminococcus sp.]|nr:YdcF family protein [Ruminococcus sp.]